MTTLTPRSPFVPCPTHWLSSYDDFPVYRMENGINAEIPSDMVEPVEWLIHAIERRGGVFRFTSFGRSYDVSAKAVAAYKAGTGPFAKAPGYSCHNSWRAIDPDIGGSGLSKAQWDDAARSVGWSPISNEPWHFEYRDGYEHILERYGYDAMTMAMSLLAGLAWFGEDEVRALQAQAHFVGEDCGAMDGVPGPKLYAALDRVARRCEGRGY